MGAVEGYKPDQLGGLEIVKWHTGKYAIRIVGVEHPVTWDFIHQRKRNAIAMRALLLDAAGGDWTSMPRGDTGKLTPGPEAKAAILRLRAVAEDENQRRLCGQCLLCGYVPTYCACGRDVEDDDPRRWTAEDMAWAS